jgi:hypothetical protein
VGVCVRRRSGAAGRWTMVGLGGQGRGRPGYTSPAPLERERRPCGSRHVRCGRASLSAAAALCMQRRPVLRRALDSCFPTTTRPPQCKHSLRKQAACLTPSLFLPPPGSICPWRLLYAAAVPEAIPERPLKRSASPLCLTSERGERTANVCDAESDALHWQRMERRGVTSVPVQHCNATSRSHTIHA